MSSCVLVCLLENKGVMLRFSCASTQTLILLTTLFCLIYVLLVLRFRTHVNGPVQVWFHLRFVFIENAIIENSDYGTGDYGKREYDLNKHDHENSDCGERNHEFRDHGKRDYGKLCYENSDYGTDDSAKCDHE